MTHDLTFWSRFTLDAIKCGAFGALACIFYQFRKRSLFAVASLSLSYIMGCATITTAFRLVSLFTTDDGYMGYVEIVSACVTIVAAWAIHQDTRRRPFEGHADGI